MNSLNGVRPLRKAEADTFWRIGLRIIPYRFMEPEFGTQHFIMMRGEMAPGGTCGLHDHTFEESYLVLTGEVDMEIEGKTYRLQAGDVAWTGTGTSHAFFQKGDVPWRWIETKAPQVITPTGTRHFAVWNRLRGSSS